MTRGTPDAIRRPVSVLLGRSDRLTPSGRPPGLVAFLADEWRGMGIDVDVLHGLPLVRRFPDRLVFAHVGLTRLPRRYARFLGRHPHVANREVSDISKRVVSRDLLERGDAWGGPVIVKTDANCGGDPGPWPEFRDRVLQRLTPSRIYRMESSEYPVYDRVDEVPDDVWRSPRLVVERFRPEREGDYYCIRVCFVLGDVIVNERVYSKSRIIKHARIEYAEPAPVPDALHGIRARMGLDYGKVDYVVHEDGVQILDVNKTPGPAEDPEEDRRLAERLAPGIDALFAREAAAGTPPT